MTRIASEAGRPAKKTACCSPGQPQTGFDLSLQSHFSTIDRQRMGGFFSSAKEPEVIGSLDCRSTTCSLLHKCENRMEFVNSESFCV